MSHLNLPYLAGTLHRPAQSLRPPASRRHSAGSSVFDQPATANQLPRSSYQLSTGPSPAPIFESDSALSDELEDSIAYLVISGGTGCNGIVSAFGDSVTYVMPVSDNGGSSSEIIRVLGGPSIGDIRSRLIRLIPTGPPQSPTEAIRGLLSHRLSVNHTENTAREEWRDIVEGRSPLWKGIPLDRKETIRRFLVYFENEVLRRAQKRFSFRNGSVGNYFLTAAYLFFRSVPSAIFLFSSITGSKAHILPALVTNHTVTIAAELADSTKIVGQCEISHPVKRPSVPPSPALVHQVSGKLKGFTLGSDDEDEEDEDQQGKDEPEQRQPRNLDFGKQGEASDVEILGSPIRRVFYINQFGQEVFPRPNPELISALATRDILVYSVGSLWTSIIPCLAMRGVASAIARSPGLRAKVFLLNAYNDRETGGYSAVDYIRAIVRTLNSYDVVVQAQHTTRTPITDGTQASGADYPVSAFITHLVYLQGTEINVDELSLTALGVKCVCVQGQVQMASKKLLYRADDVRDILRRIVQQS
ncbi:hypothetical protein FRB93_010606 [Tulasnella sp. JGI-2019a]|nr:hypothetical protein FRB93_010606 [Tulasnella sp. JGI-2019a]